MGCDIHLHIETRYKKNNQVWWFSSFTQHSSWRDRLYGMFARLANVRSYQGNAALIPLRGFPEDATFNTKRKYGLRVSPIEKEEYFDWECSEKEAERWVKDGSSTYFEIRGSKYITHPDWHSPNWCTTKEMEMCINDCFKKEDGTYQGDYIEWIALLGIMKAYESTGEYECRAVFWFDN